MRNRSAALLKRLQGIEQQRHTAVAQPVALWPQLVSIAEWSAAAQTSQERLKVHVKSEDDGRCDYSDLPKLRLVASSQVRQPTLRTSN